MPLASHPKAGEDERIVFHPDCILAAEHLFPLVKHLSRD
jgi:hypothetical protein